MDGDYGQHLGIIESAKEFKERRRTEQSNVLKQKSYGQFFNQIDEVTGSSSIKRDRSIKRETESL